MVLLGMILILQHSQDKHSINCSIFRHKTKSHFINGHYFTKFFSKKETCYTRSHTVQYFSNTNSFLTLQTSQLMQKNYFSRKSFHIITNCYEMTRDISTYLVEHRKTSCMLNTIILIFLSRKITIHYRMSRYQAY